MTFTQSIATCFIKYATFTGRASRSEFWWFALFTVLLSAATGVVDKTLGTEMLTPLLNVGLLLPRVSAGVRRLHDIGKSGLWMLLIFTIVGIIALIALWAMESAEDAARKAGEYGSGVRDDV
ncbi:MAG: DUF805 domain-containing protein [Gammaproteobacteria bacterium]